MSGMLAGLAGKAGGSLRGIDTPHQLALGLVLGMLVGLVPKFSLLAVAFGLLLILTNANLLTGILSVLLFSGVSKIIDGLTHGIGHACLNWSPIQSTVEASLALPLVAWLRLENTVVCGNFVLGIALSIPLYMLGLRFFKKYREAVDRRVRRSPLTRWILGYSPTELPEAP